MICITVTESDGEYISVESNGHAGYAEEGQDIICAAVSALIVNTVNSVETSPVRLLTYMAVREDAILLYGFLTQEEYDLFLIDRKSVV